MLGAGFGGLTAATELAAAGRDVTLVDERDSFMMGLGLLQMVDGRRKPGDGARRLADVARRGVTFLQASVERIDLGAKRVETSRRALAFEHLVVALGAKLAPVPAGHNLYSAEGAAALHRDLAALQGGDVLIVVTSTPFKCPPAPYEAAMLAKGFLDARGVDATVTLATPETQPLPAAGPECGLAVRGYVEDRGVDLLLERALQEIDPQRRVARFTDGTERRYDVLAVVPAHRPPESLATSGLALEGGWVKVDPATLQTSAPGAWAVGDCTLVKLANGKPLVKAGVMAEGEGRVVAKRILGEDARFDGKGGCFLELGRGEAIEVAGDFYATPNPRVTAQAPSKAALAKKGDFERERLERWFGSS